jgi:hypothetical protein
VKLRAPSAAARAHQSDDRRNGEQDNGDDEDQLGRLDGDARDPAKAEHGGDQRDD